MLVCHETQKFDYMQLRFGVIKLEIILVAFVFFQIYSNQVLILQNIFFICHFLEARIKFTLIKITIKISKVNKSFNNCCFFQVLALLDTGASVAVAPLGPTASTPPLAVSVRSVITAKKEHWNPSFVNLAK